MKRLTLIVAGVAGVAAGVLAVAIVGADVPLSMLAAGVRAALGLDG